jgi:RNA polymerase sigma factor (sigma-70 family)
LKLGLLINFGAPLIKDGIFRLVNGLPEWQRFFLRALASLRELRAIFIIPGINARKHPRARIIYVLVAVIVVHWAPTPPDATVTVSPRGQALLQNTLRDVLDRLRRAWAVDNARGLTDRALLDRFLATREETAFAVLVQRYGPMVLNVCRRMLGDPHAAEDAFQATFLVLTRRARTIRQNATIGSWLYAVAWRIAMRARTQTSTRRRRECKAVEMATVATEPLDALTLQELRSVLDEELGRLPEKYRAPVVLCYLQGLTQEGAAKQLRCAKGTLARRLNRALELLRKHLVRRGLTLSAATLATALAENTTAAPLGAGLLLKTVDGILCVAAGKTLAGAISKTALSLAEEAMRGSITLAPLVPTKYVVTAGVIFAGIAMAAGVAQVRQQPASNGQTLAAPAMLAPTKPFIPVAQPVTPRTDRFGDPLPDGAIARLGTTRLRHGDPVWCLGFSPDGKTLMSADWHGVHVWDAATGKHLRRFGDPGSRQFQAVALSPDCRMVAITHQDHAGSKGRIEIWDATAARLLRQFVTGRFPSVHFSPDGKTLTVVPYGDENDEKLLQLWDVATGEKRRELRGHQDRIHGLDFSSDAKTMVTSSDDKSIRFWDVATGQQIRRFDQAEPVGSIALAPDGKTVASVAMTKHTTKNDDGSVATFWVASDFVILRDATTGKEIHRLKGDNQQRIPEMTAFHSGVTSFCFGPDGKTLLSNDSRFIYWWDIGTGKELAERRIPASFVSVMLFTPDGKTLATGGFNNVIRFWDTVTGNEKSLTAGHQSTVHTVAVSPDSRLFATGGADQGIRLWDAITSEQRAHFTGHAHIVWSLAFAADGKTLFSDGLESPSPDDWTVRAWDIATGKELRRFPGSWFALAPDGKVLLTGGKDLPIHAWDAVTHQELRQWKALGLGPAALTFSADGRTLFALCEEDKTVRSWSAVTGKLLRSFPSHRFVEDSHDRTYCHAFSPDGTLMAFGGQMNYIALYDMTTGTESTRLSDPHLAGPISTLAFSPDGRTLVSGDWAGGKIHFWELATGKHFRQFAGHQGRNLGLAFSPDGSLLLTADSDTTVLVWDQTGKHTLAKAEPLTVQALEARWADLASADAARAQQAVRTLATAPEQALAFLGKQLKPAPAPDAKRIAQLIAELDGGQFKNREEAMRELENMGDITAPALQTTINGNANLELKQRLQVLLEKFSTSQRLRTLRAVQVLEQMGTPESLALLVRLAQGEAIALLTREARAAVNRRSRG